MTTLIRILPSVLLTACSASGQSTAPDPAPTDSTKRLAKSLDSGRWTTTTERSYAELVLLLAEARCGRSPSPEFWQWVRRFDKVRNAVVWATTTEPKPSFFQCLDQLRLHDTHAVEQLPHLAIGFALAWCPSEGDEPARPFASWTRGRRPIPSMTESFGWYVQHRKQLAFPIHRASFPVLAYTALNDVPLDERRWVLRRHRGKRLEQLRELFGEVPYIHDGLQGKAQSLPNMVEHGGVCTVNTQYQMATMRTLGVPATFGGGPGHCWPCWLGGTGKSTRFDRSNDLGNHNGSVGEPAFAWHEHESDLRLLAAGLARGRDSFRAAELCAAAIRLVADQTTDLGWSALEKTLRKNPFVFRAWQTAAHGMADQRMPAALARGLLRRLPKALAHHPDVALTILAAAIPAPVSQGFDDEVADAFVAACRELGSIAPESSRAKRAQRLVVEFYAATGAVAQSAELRLRLLQAAQDDAAATDSKGFVRTRALGGTGGSKFASMALAGARLLGFRYSATTWSGHRVLSSIQTVYEHGERTVTGPLHGEERGEVRELLAPAGASILGIEARSGQLFDGFRLVTGKIDPKTRQPIEIAFSGWAGGSGNGWGRLLGGRSEVVGIHGRAGSSIDALGLIERPAN